MSFALLKAPERRGESADIHRLRRDVEEVVEDAADLAPEHADMLGPHGNLNPKELFRREAEGVLLVHRRHVIEAVEIGDRLKIGLVLDQLFCAAVKQSDMRIDALDDLAVKLENKAQDAMRGRMLRPEIDGERASGGLVRGRVLDLDEFRVRHVHFAFSSPGNTYFAPSQGER